jgi:precorrin-6A/cobalt-precorrin-6A reductase
MPTMDSQRGDAALWPEVLSIEGSLAADMSRVLILGGTTEARELAERLAKRADLEVVVSLAGRTKSPAPQPVPVRAGGFGGATGLADYLRNERIDALIDATHPYANVISVSASAATRQAGVALIVLRRPPWRGVAGDRWSEAVDVADAVCSLGERPRRVFVTLGRTELAALTTAPQHFYLIRSVDPVEPPLPLPRVRYITERGPFSAADDRALMSAHAIDAVIAKNSGGSASYGKIAAARALGIEVIMLRRPVPPDAPAGETVDEVIAWLDHAIASAMARGTARGV